MGNDATVRIAGDVGALLGALLSGKLGMREFVSEVQAGMRDAAAEMDSTTKGAGQLEGGLVGMIAKGTFLGGMLKDLAMGALRMVKDAVVAVASEFMRGVSLSNEFNTALTGLRAVAAGTGNDLGKTEQAAKDFASNGLMTISSAATSLKNLLATGFSLPDAIKLMKVAGDSAAFNRQGMLGYGEAVERFTQGIKFNNSALTDSTGLGKNLSVIMKDAGMSTDAAGNAANSAAVRQAILNGFMKEGALFTGNAAKYTETYGGQLARLTSTYNTFLATLGDAVTKNQTVISVMGILSDAFAGTGKSMNLTQTAANLVSDAIVLIVKSVGWLLSALDFLQQAWYQGKVASALFDAALQSIILQINRAALAFLEFIAKMDPTGLAAKALAGSIGTLKDQVNASRFAMEQAADAAGKNDQKWKENSATIAGWKVGIADAVVKLEATRGKLVEVGFATDNVAKKTEAAEKPTKAQIAAAKRWADVMDELNTAGGSYQATLDGINGSTVEAIKYYLEAGVSVAALAKAYDLTDVQIKAVVSSMKDEKELLGIMAAFRKETYALSQKAEKDFHAEQQRLLKISNDATAKSITDTAALWREHYDTIAKRTLSSTDYQILKAHEWADDERKKLDTSDLNWKKHAEAIAVIERDKVIAIKLANNPVYQDWQRLTGDMRQAWDGLFVAALHGADSFKDAIKGVFTTLKNDVLQIFADILKAFLEGLIKKMILGAAAGNSSITGIFSGLLGGGAGIVPGIGGTAAGAGGTAAVATGATGAVGGASVAGGAGGAAGAGGGAAGIGAALAGGAVIGGAGLGLGALFQKLFDSKEAGAIGGGLSGAGAGALIGTMVFPGIGTGIGALIGGLSGVLGGVLGGPSKKEQGGRELVAELEKQLAGMLTTTQKLEAGNESWKMTVIAVRDAYTATGRSGAEAEAAVKALWASSKGGAGAVEAAMKPILAALEAQQKLLAGTADVSADTTATIVDGLGTMGAALDSARSRGTIWAQGMRADLEMVKAGIDAVSVGESFGGIKEWIPMLRESQAAFRALASTAVGELGGVKRAVNIGAIKPAIVPIGGDGTSPAGAGAGDDHIHLHFHDVIDGHGVELATERTLLPALTKVLSRGRGLRELKQVLS